MQLPSFTKNGSSQLLFSTSPEKVLRFLLSVEYFHRAFSLGFLLRPLGALNYNWNTNMGDGQGFSSRANQKRSEIFSKSPSLLLTIKSHATSIMAIHHGALTLSSPAEISADTDNFLFG